jgi:TonB family protein
VPIREIPPQIPVQLKQLVQGENVVQVLVHINTTGSVTEAKLGDVKGPSAGFLSKLALNAARGWQFRPATQNGTAVPSDKILEFLFRPSAR